MAPAKKLSVASRRNRWKLITEVEKASARLWCDTWGGRAVATPRFEAFDFFWCDVDTIVGALEVKQYVDKFSSAWQERQEKRPVVVPATKYFAALGLEAQNLALYLIVCLPHEVLWAPVLEASRLKLVRNTAAGATAGGGGRLELACIFEYDVFRRLSGQPLFDERDPGGKRWMAPT